MDVGESFDADGFPEILNIRFHYEGKDISLSLHKDLSNPSEANVHVFENGAVKSIGLNVRKINLKTEITWKVFIDKKNQNFRMKMFSVTIVNKMAVQLLPLQKTITTSSEL